MMEYLDERFPHPPLLPAYPVARAQTRQYAHRVERDWCVLVDTIFHDKNAEKVANARKSLAKTNAEAEKFAALKLSLIHISEPTRPY